MANEATVRASLSVRKMDSGGTILLTDYQSRPSSFNTNVSAVGGPCPGEITATLAGTDIDLSQLTAPGLCRIMNMDPANYVEVGVWDPDTTEFLPMLEMLPGETYVIRLSRLLGQEYAGTAGTASTGTAVRLRIKAITANCKVLVEAFER